MPGRVGAIVDTRADRRRADRSGLRPVESRRAAAACAAGRPSCRRPTPRRSASISWSASSPPATSCCQPRVQNIHRIADLLDQRIVRPDETFSINAIVGERTVKNGFVAAPSIEDGEMVDTVGGGISQFATTFFNAVFYGGYDIIERAPHTYWFSRYPMGHEATLSYPKPDIIFKNDSKAGILIDTSYTDTSITVKLYGDNGGRRVRAQVSPRFAVVEPTVELVPDPRRDPGRGKGRRKRHDRLVGARRAQHHLRRRHDQTRKTQSDVQTPRAPGSRPSLPHPRRRTRPHRRKMSGSRSL